MLWFLAPASNFVSGLSESLNNLSRQIATGFFEVVSRTPAFQFSKDVATGVVVGKAYVEKKSEYQTLERRVTEQKLAIEQQIESWKKAGVIREEGDKLVVQDEAVYKKLSSDIERYNVLVKTAKLKEQELRKLESFITPSYTSADYPLVGKQLRAGMEEAYNATSWFMEEANKAGVISKPFGEFATGFASAVIFLPETPAFVASAIKSPAGTVAGLTVQAIEKPAEFAGSLVGGVVVGKAVGKGVGKVAGEIREAITTPKPIKETVAFGDHVVYTGKPLESPLILERSRIVHAEPVAAMVERMGMRAENVRLSAERVEKGLETEFSAKPSEFFKAERLEFGYKLIPKEQVDITRVVEYQSVADKLLGRKSMLISRETGEGVFISKLEHVKVEGSEFREIASKRGIDVIPGAMDLPIKGLSAEKGVLISLRVSEELPMAKPETAFQVKPKEKTPKKLTIKTSKPFEITDEPTKPKESVKVESGKQNLIAEQKPEKVKPIYSFPVAFPLARATAKGEVAIPLVFPPHTSASVKPAFNLKPTDMPKFSPAGEIEPSIAKVKPDIKTKTMEGEITLKKLRTKDTGDLREKERNITGLKASPRVETRQEPIVAQITKPIQITKPTVKPEFKIALFPRPPPFPIPKFPKLPTKPEEKRGKKRDEGKAKSKDWWTGLTASYNLLTAYEVKGGKGKHLLTKEAEPYWREFLSSAGFVGIPVAQEIKKGRGSRL